jgi:hypothetical protein
MSFFNCVTVEGQTYLWADMRERCYDAQWRSFLPVNLVFVGIYPVGIPVVMASLLVYGSRNKKLQTPEYRESLGLMYLMYEKHRYFFEVIDMVPPLSCVKRLILYVCKDM